MSFPRAEGTDVLVAIVLTLHVPSPHAGPTVHWTPAIEPLTTPAADGSAQPQLTVSSRGVLLSWIERDGSRATLKFSERAPRGWSEPRVVASGDDWFVNWADVPSVLRLSNGTLAAHWLRKSGADEYAYDVWLAYSRDDGRTWSQPFTPHHDGTKTEHGFASLVELPGVGLGLVWLDGRGMTPGSSHTAHAGDGGAMSVRFASFDTGWKQTAEMPVDLRVCECCPTTAVVTSDGPVVAFRDRSEDEVRDIYLSRFANGGWTEPRPVYADGWKISACPVNGPMLAARERELAIAWFTGKDDEGHVFVAFSRDAARSFGPPIRLDDAISLGRVDVELLNDGSAVATWIEFAEGRSHLLARRVLSSGARSTPVRVSGIESSRASGYPRLARHDNELVFAWTESHEGRLRVRTARAATAAAVARVDPLQ